MTPERMAELVRRWARCYTRKLPAPIARRRIDEIAADLHDHIAHERAAGIGDRRVALGIASRMQNARRQGGAEREHGPLPRGHGQRRYAVARGFANEDML